MAYLPSFDYDIFISYAHVDNASKRGSPGWVEQFHGELVRRLDRRLGEMSKAKIWWDDRLGGSHVFDQTIKKAVSRSAIFLAMTSTGYLGSSYCKDELDLFCEKAEREPPGLVVGDRARVLNVLLDATPYPRWPAKYGGTNGFHFYDEETDEPMGVDVKEFRAELSRLTAEVYEILEAMKGAATPPAAEKKVVEEKKDEDVFSVFIADTSSSLKTLRQRVLSELRQRKDVHIYDRIPPPALAADHEAKVREVVTSADLCIHLLDGTPGREIDDQPEKSYLERQAELSLELARSQFVWVPTDLKIRQVTDDAHRNLLRRLEGVTDEEDEPEPDAAAPDPEGEAPLPPPAAGADGEGRTLVRPEGDGYKFVRNLLNAVPRDILERIDQLKKERAAQPPEAREVLRAFVDTHIKDQQHVLALSGFLAQRKIVPLINFEEDTPSKGIESYESQLRRANLLIVVYGGVPPEWVRERLFAALKFAVTQQCPLRACGVYIAPPSKRAEDKRFDIPLLNVDVLDNTERFDPATLNPLLARI